MCHAVDHVMTLVLVLCCVAVAAIAAHMWLEVLDQIKRRKSVRHTISSDPQSVRHTISSDPLSAADVVRYVTWRNEQTIKALNERKDGGVQ